MPHKTISMGGKKKRKHKDGYLWYHKGLRFECTQCGDCCTGRPGNVQFTSEEGAAMAAELGMEEDDFYEQFASPAHPAGTWQMGEVSTEYGFDCLMLGRCEETGKTFCRAHSSRPTQCRTWPFWPENLTSERAWKVAASECEGIGRGSFISLRVIQEQAAETPPWGER